MMQVTQTMMLQIRLAAVYVFFGTLGSLASALPATAAPLDDFGPPAEGDPSAFTGPFIGLKFARKQLENLPPANDGAFVGGPTETFLDAGVNIAVPEDEQRKGGKFDIPTNGLPSPLFGAQSFSQQMLRFEEFGTDSLDPAAPPAVLTFPLPTLGPGPEQDPLSVAASQPAGASLDAFLVQPGISPFPMQFSNRVDLNPWRQPIEDFLFRLLVTPPAEGRPPGKGWSHQRWNEFFPEIFFKTVQAGSRENSGFRDDRQRHHYLLGEFGPGGLYHNTAGLPATEGTTGGIRIRFHPDMPVQNHKSLWTFDGTLPPKLLMVRHGQPVLLRHYNALPIDPGANRGFGLHTITTHEHNGHSPAESDGYTNAFFSRVSSMIIAGRCSWPATIPSIPTPPIPGRLFPVQREKPSLSTMVIPV